MQSKKELALIIRCHGVIPVYPTNPADTAALEAAQVEAAANTNSAEAKSLELEICLRRLHLLNFRHDYNIENMTVVGLAKLGKPCIGSSDIFSLVKAAGTHYNDQNGRQKPVEEKINEVLLSPRPPAKIQDIKNRICGYDAKDCILANIDLKKVDLKSHCIEKYYTKFDKNSGVFMLFNSGFTTEELKKLNNLLKKINEIIVGNEDVAPSTVVRSYILAQLSEFNISKLFFCDFTCNLYDSTDGKHSLLLEETNKLTHYLEIENLRGGKKKKRKSSMRRKSMSSKKTLKNKK